MIGGSYDGTTANMVAVRGADAPGLKAIVPELAISRWYGYAYGSGVRYFLNSQRPSDEGVDTPLAFDFGIARTPPTQPTPEAIEAMQDRLQPCDADEHTAHGYDTSPDYDAFWRERDYLRHAANVRAAALVVHGWQDYNVKQSEGVDFYRALPGFKRLFMFQGGHQSPPADRFLPVLDAFFNTTLKGAPVAPALRPPVITQGRDSAAAGGFRTEASWPPAGVREMRLELGRGAEGGTLSPSAPPGHAAYTDLGTTSEEVALRGLDAETTWLAYRSAPLRGDVRIAGTPRLRLVVGTSTDHAHVTPTLVDIAPDGSAKPISRGFLNLRYRAGLEREVPMPTTRPVTATVRFSPQDHTVRAGHRIAVVVAGSNVIWALPDEPAGTRTTVFGGSALVLPVADG
jgi:X-Pro dipeptidyl-peptidase